MFKKKNPVKKLEIKSEPQSENKININIMPLVTIEKHESRVNGKVQAPEFRISIGGRDVLMLNSREYNELFSEMLRRMDNDEIMHALFEKHAMEHAEASGQIDGMIKHIVGSKEFASVIKNLEEQAKKEIDR